MHVAHTGEIKYTYKILIIKPEARDHVGGLGIRGSLILKRPYRHRTRRGLDSSTSVQRHVTCSCEHGYEPSGSKKKSGNFLHQLSDY
jgi:hypothetical protein